MLKSLQSANILNNTQIINKTSKTKCAEIHFFTSDFTINCIICKKICNEYQDFTDHFHRQHFEEFIKKFQTPELCSKNDNFKEQKPKLIQQTLIVPVKQEQPERLCQQQEQWITQVLMSEELPEENEDITCGELLNCKIEEEQETDDLESITHITKRSFESEDSETITNNEADEKCSDVDWSHSFAPTLLKINQKRPYKPRNQPNSCSYCGKTFRRRYQLDTHLNIHTGIKPHQCDVCGRQFRAITTLQRHLSTHEKRQNFRCKYCCKEFSHRAAFVSHETRHTQERRVPCDDCDKLFYTQNQLDTHKHKLHNKLDDNSLPFACDLCTKRYRSASMLSTHKFKKHYKMAKYACEQCGKKFVDQQQLTNHMSIHVKKNGM